MQPTSLAHEQCSRPSSHRSTSLSTVCPSTLSSGLRGGGLTKSAEVAAGTVTTIEALNEPNGWVQGALDPIKSYYRDGYEIVRHPAGPSKQTQLLYSISDAFQPYSTFDTMFPWPQYQGVAIDTHIYTVFTNQEVAMNLQQRIQAYCGRTNTLKASRMWMTEDSYVGEWSPAPTDCAPRLNGQGRGARYDGTFQQDGGSSRIGSCSGLSGSSSSFSPAYKQELRKLWEVQTQVYESASLGWVMWAWKTENASDWDYSRGVQGGWIPKDPTQRIYGDQCS